MAKQILSHAELLRRVRQVFESHAPECGHLQIDGLEVRDDQSAIANWHVDWARVAASSAAGADVRACQLKTGDAIAALRQACDCEPPATPESQQQPSLW